MKNHFASFTVRFLAILILGIFLLLLRAVAHDPVTAWFIPQFASPWELSKLVYWPLLLAALLPTEKSGLQKRVAATLPWLVITPMAALAIYWGLSAIRPGPGAYLLVWIILSAAALLLSQRGALSAGDRSIWLVLAAALGILYIVLTFLPPMAGPFLDPSDVAAMATIPF